MIIEGARRRGSCCEPVSNEDRLTDTRSMAEVSDGGSVRRMRTVDDLRTGDHAAFIYANEQEHKAVVVPFVRAGFDSRQRVIYIHDRRSPQAISAMLSEGGVDADLAQATGQLVFVPAKQMYTRGAGYSFDSVLDKMHAMTAMALADGWSAVRATTEMSWVLRQTQGTDNLLEEVLQRSFSRFRIHSTALRSPAPSRTVPADNPRSLRR